MNLFAERPPGASFALGTCRSPEWSGVSSAVLEEDRKPVQDNKGWKSVFPSALREGLPVRPCTLVSGGQGPVFFCSRGPYYLKQWSNPEREPGALCLMQRAGVFMLNRCGDIPAASTSLGKSLCLRHLPALVVTIVGVPPCDMCCDIAWIQFATVMHF